MIDLLASIDWSVDHTAFSILGREIRWYGIFWATGVLLTALVVQKMFINEKYPEKWFDSFFVYILTGLIIGARLGHCLFYDPVHYLSNPLDLFKIWEGGLASHGGAIGMVIGICLFSIKVSVNLSDKKSKVVKKKINWKMLGIAALIGIILGRIAHAILNPSEPFSIVDMNNTLMLGSMIMGLSVGVCVALVLNSTPICIEMLDRLVVGVAIGATFIRLGNLMNSEIYGGHTTLPWGFNFLKDRAWHDAGALPSHPTQIYEALIYFCIFLLGMFLYWQTKAKEKTGLILGVSLIGIFGSRFFIEFIKNVQEEFENDMLLNMGQILSIPFVLWGIYLVWHALKAEKDTIKK